MIIWTAPPLPRAEAIFNVVLLCWHTVWRPFGRLDHHQSPKRIPHTEKVVGPGRQVICCHYSPSDNHTNCSCSLFRTELRSISYNFPKWYRRQLTGITSAGRFHSDSNIVQLPQNNSLLWKKQKQKLTVASDNWQGKLSFVQRQPQCIYKAATDWQLLLRHTIKDQRWLRGCMCSYWLPVRGA